MPAFTIFSQFNWWLAWQCLWPERKNCLNDITLGHYVEFCADVLSISRNGICDQNKRHCNAMQKNCYLWSPITSLSHWVVAGFSQLIFQAALNQLTNGNWWTSKLLMRLISWFGLLCNLPSQNLLYIQLHLCCNGSCVVLRIWTRPAVMNVLGSNPGWGAWEI